MKLMIQTVFSPIGSFRRALLEAFGIEQGRDGRLSAEKFIRTGGTNFSALMYADDFDAGDPLCELLSISSDIQEGEDGIIRGGTQWGLEPLLRSIYLDQGMQPGLMFLNDDEADEVRVGLASAEQVRWFDGPDLIKAMLDHADAYPLSRKAL